MRGVQILEQIAQRCWRLSILREIQKPVWQPDLFGPALLVGRRREAFQNGTGRKTRGRKKASVK